MYWSTMGTMGNYMLQMKRTRLWEMKKSGYDPEVIKKAEDTLDTHVKVTLSAIVGKLKAGKKLSTAEMEFLKVNSPQTYSKAVAIAKEREEYRKKLEKCKTKEDAQRLHTEKLQSLVKEADAGANPEEIAIRVAQINDEHISFSRTTKLPSEEDLRKKKKVQKKVKIRVDKADFAKKKEKTLEELLAEKNIRPDRSATDEQKPATAPTSANPDGADEQGADSDASDVSIPTAVPSGVQYSAKGEVLVTTTAPAAAAQAASAPSPAASASTGPSTGTGTARARSSSAPQGAARTFSAKA